MMMIMPGMNIGRNVILMTVKHNINKNIKRQEYRGHTQNTP